MPRFYDSVCTAEWRSKLIRKYTNTFYFFSALEYNI